MLARQLSVPTWSQPAGAPYRNGYQIDHIRELQLVNFSADNTYANEPENLWLLDSGVNQTSGTRIDGQIRQQVTTFTEGLLEYYKLREAALGNRRNPTAAAREALARDLGRARHPDLASSSRTYAEYTLEFDAVAAGIEPRAVTREQYWRANEIENARHLRFLEARSVVADAGHIAIFANATNVAARAADQGMPVPDTPASDGQLTSVAATQDVEWVQFRLNDREDDVEILQPVRKLRPKGEDKLPAATMNQSFCQPVAYNQEASEWAVCNHFDQARLAVLKFRFDRETRRYDWVETSPFFTAAKASLTEASLARLGKAWLITGAVLPAGSPGSKRTIPFGKR